MTLAHVAALIGILAAPDAPWLADIRTRAEADARAAAAGDPAITVTEDDLKTIRTKLEFLVVRPSDELEALRRYVARRIAGANLGASGEEMAVCRRAPIGVDSLTLGDVASALARESDRERRRRIVGAAAAEAARLQPIAQYAWLAESRELARLLRQPGGGFRSRSEERVVAMADAARHVFNETEESHRWLSARISEDELAGEPIELADVVWLLHAPLRSELSTERNRAAVAATLEALGVTALPEGLIRDGAGDGWLGPHVQLRDPPRQLDLTLPWSEGVGGLADMLRGQGVALSYSMTRPDATFEPRWLGDASVRDAYGRLLESLALDGAWIDARLALAPELRARYVRAVAWARLTEARRAAALVLFEAALTDPRASTQGIWSVLHEQALGTSIPFEVSALHVEDMAHDSAGQLDALLMAARMKKALEGQAPRSATPGGAAGAAGGAPWWKDPRGTRKLQDGLRQAGFETPEELRDRFRAQRDDARTLVDQLLGAARDAGYPAK